MRSDLLGWPQPQGPRPRPSCAQRPSAQTCCEFLLCPGLAWLSRPWRGDRCGPLLSRLRLRSAPRVCSSQEGSQAGPVSGRRGQWLSELGTHRPGASEPSALGPQLAPNSAFRCLRPALPPARKAHSPRRCLRPSSALPHPPEKRLQPCWRFCSPGFPSLGLCSGQSQLLSRSACFLLSPVAYSLWI